MLLAIALAAATAVAPLPSGFAPCRIDGSRRAAFCGSVEVPEDRARGDSRILPLRVMIVPAQSRAPRPDPILFLAGGPGQGAASIAALVLRLLEGIDRDRAVILVDVRGTGASNPLTCQDTGRLMRGARNESFDRCLASLTTRADLRQYTTRNIAADLEEVRQTLGLGQLNLVAVSYGTRVATEYLLEHPAQVRAAVLRGVDPLDGKTFLRADRGAAIALQSIIAECGRERSCAMAYPSLRREASSIPQLLARQSRTVEVVDPDTSTKRLLDAGYPLYHDLLYALMLDEVGRREVPETIHRIAVEGVAGLARLAARNLGGYDEVSAGLYYSVTCAEDEPRLTDAERLEIATLETATSQPDGRCERWPKPDPLPSPLAIGNPGVPILMISGADDPATAPAGAAALAPRLGAKHLLIAAGSHTPLFPGCAPRLVREFLDDPSHTIDPRCLASRKHQEFFVRRNR